MTKHYRVKQTNFLWKEGAILQFNNNNGYVPIEDIWNNTPVNEAEYISTRIVEHPNNSEFFERVYKDTLGGALYKTKDQMIEAYKGVFKS